MSDISDDANASVSGHTDARIGSASWDYTLARVHAGADAHSVEGIARLTWDVVNARGVRAMLGMLVEIADITEA